MFAPRLHACRSTCTHGLPASGALLHRQPRSRGPLYKHRVPLQGLPPYLQQYDMGYRGADPPLAQSSFGSMQTAAGPALQQPGFVSQVIVSIGSPVLSTPMVIVYC